MIKDPNEHYTLNIHYIINYNINKYIYYTYISVYSYMSLSTHHKVKEINSVQVQFPDTVMKKLPVQNIQQGRLKNRNFQQTMNNPQSEDQRDGSCYFTDINKPHPLNSKCLFTGTCEICFNSCFKHIHQKSSKNDISDILSSVLKGLKWTCCFRKHTLIYCRKQPFTLLAPFGVRQRKKNKTRRGQTGSVGQKRKHILFILKNLKTEPEVNEIKIQLKPQQASRVSRFRKSRSSQWTETKGNQSDIRKQ